MPTSDGTWVVSLYDRLVDEGVGQVEVVDVETYTSLGCVMLGGDTPGRLMAQPYGLGDSGSVVYGSAQLVPIEG